MSSRNKENEEKRMIARLRMWLLGLVLALVVAQRDAESSERYCVARGELLRK